MAFSFSSAAVAVPATTTEPPITVDRGTKPAGSLGLPFIFCGLAFVLGIRVYLAPGACMTPSGSSQRSQVQRYGQEQRVSQQRQGADTHV
jgi:hypothetical protein